MGREFNLSIRFELPDSHAETSVRELVCPKTPELPAPAKQRATEALALVADAGEIRALGLVGPLASPRTYHEARDLRHVRSWLCGHRTSPELW
jgi:hypothetical protein